MPKTVCRCWLPAHLRRGKECPVHIAQEPRSARTNEPHLKGWAQGPPSYDERYWDGDVY